MARPKNRQRAGGGAVVPGAKRRRSRNDYSGGERRKKGRLVVKFKSLWMNPGRTVVFRCISPLLRREGVFLPASLEGFLATEELWYPELVAQFYRNLRCSIDKSKTAAATVILSSTVRGINVTMDERTLGTVTGLPPRGLDLHQATCRKLGWDEADITRRLYGAEAVPNGAFGSPNRLYIKSTRYLSPAARILAYIVAHDLVPRGDWHHDLALQTALPIYALMEGMEVNWPRMFLQMMTRAMACNKPLPYGVLLTRVFRHCGVPLLGQVEGTKTTKLDELSLRRMKLVDGVGRAVKEEDDPSKKYEESEGQELEEGDEERVVGRDSDGGAEATVCAGSSSSAHMRDLHRFFWEICDNYTEMRFKVLNLKDRVAAIGDRIELRLAALEKQQDELFDCLKRHFPAPLTSQES